MVLAKGAGEGGASVGDVGRRLRRGRLLLVLLLLLGGEEEVEGALCREAR